MKMASARSVTNRLGGIYPSTRPIVATMSSPMGSPRQRLRIAARRIAVVATATQGTSGWHGRWATLDRLTRNQERASGTLAWPYRPVSIRPGSERPTDIGRKLERLYIRAVL